MWFYCPRVGQAESLVGGQPGRKTIVSLVNTAKLQIKQTSK